MCLVFSSIEIPTRSREKLHNFFHAETRPKLRTNTFIVLMERFQDPESLVMDILEGFVEIGSL